MSTRRQAQASSPHTEHVDQVLLGHIVFLADVPLQRRKYRPPLCQRLSAVPLQLPQLVVGHARLDVRLGKVASFGDGKVLELFPEHNDGLFRDERIGRLVGIWVRHDRKGLLGVETAWRSGRAVESSLGVGPEFQDVVEAIWVELFVNG